MGIDKQQDSLRQGATALRHASAQARGWVARVAQGATSVANEEHVLLDATRSAENLARKLEASSSQRPSAGVFGPSQAGKSYLVSVLGKHKGKPLMVDFAGQLKNFIQEINPEGGKEATGLVTRFTIAKGTDDAAFPVEMRLLTETDLVKIMGNSFFSDFDPHKRLLALPAEEEIRAAVARLSAKAGGSCAHVDEISMFDIGEYFRANYKTSIGPLSRAGYWDALTSFGHRLGTVDRTELYSLLWGGTKDITAMFSLMLAAVEKLGHAANARAVLECLVPRGNSIIDVDIVRHKLGTKEDQADLLKVVPLDAAGKAGRPVELSRATLCALVAELRITVADKPWDFFDHTDLLDFPGARSREQMIDLPSDPENRAETIRNMVRRGKVSYLFQRYTEDRELACMLLCMPPSNAEVKDLSALVKHWVYQTHGDKPEARGQLACALFFVLTFFDVELLQKPGDTPESVRNRIETRLDASMYQLYKQEEWLQEWNPGKPFDSTYFLRNPGFKREGVFQYEGDRETGLTPQIGSYLAAVREGALEGEKARKHIRDVAGAWDAMITLNDGGVSRLVSNLESVLSPELKVRQLAGRLAEQARVLDAHLRRFYQADDDSSRHEKDNALKALRRRLFKACSERGYVNFVQMLSLLKIGEADVRGAFLNVASLKLDSIAAAPVEEPGKVAVEAAAEDDPWADSWAEEDDAAPAAGKPASVLRRSKDRFDYFAIEVLNLWTEKVRTLSSDAPLLARLGMDSQLVGDLGNELVVGAHRNELIERIADRVRTQVAAANLRWDEVADRSAGIATMMVNDFVAYLGFGELPVDQRAAVPEPPEARQRGVFTPPPRLAAGEIPTLSDARVQMERTYFMDWGVAFKQLGLDNVSFSGGREIGEADNRELGEILQELGSAAKAGAA